MIKYLMGNISLDDLFSVEEDIKKEKDCVCRIKLAVSEKSGIKKRRVEPDSLHSILVSVMWQKSFMPVTVTEVLSHFISAPSLRIHSIVARISWE